MKTFKRKKFKAHKCEKLLSEEEIRIIKEAMAISKQDMGSHVSPLIGGAGGKRSILD
jgi:hypothetical protein